MLRHHTVYAWGFTCLQFAYSHFYSYTINQTLGRVIRATVTDDLCKELSSKIIILYQRVVTFAPV